MCCPPYQHYMVFLQPGPDSSTCEAAAINRVALRRTQQYQLFVIQGQLDKLFSKHRESEALETDVSTHWFLCSSFKLLTSVMASLTPLNKGASSNHSLKPPLNLPLTCTTSWRDICLCVVLCHDNSERGNI